MQPICVFQRPRSVYKDFQEVLHFHFSTIKRWHCSALWGWVGVFVLLSNPFDIFWSEGRQGRHLQEGKKRIKREIDKDKVSGGLENSSLDGETKNVPSAAQDQSMETLYITQYMC